MKPGSGPEAVPAEATTYAAIQAENERRELLERSMGRWAGEAKAPLAPGQVPKLPGGPWSSGDLLGPAAPYSDTNPPDPSGTQRHRGIG